MPISNVTVNCIDLNRSIDFYTKFLGVSVVGEPTEDRATLGLVTSTLTLRRVEPRSSTWIANDLQYGFRHMGFKVDQLDARAAALKEAGVPFHLDPVHAEGNVRICFFFDPDGTLLEFVEGELNYSEVMDTVGVAEERSFGVPERPRFDHVAMTVDDRDVAESFYRPMGFSLIGTLRQPQDPRGCLISYHRSGRTVLEVFTWGDPKLCREPSPDAPGFGWVEIEGNPPSSSIPLEPNPKGLLRDPWGFVFAARPPA